MIITLCLWANISEQTAQTQISDYTLSLIKILTVCHSTCIFCRLLYGRALSLNLRVITVAFQLSNAILIFI